MEELLFPEHEWDYVNRAVERVKLAWLSHHHMNPDGKPMLLAFSGGKDSICLFFICKQASEELGFDFVGCEIDKAYFELQEKRFKEWASQLCFEF